MCGFVRYYRCFDSLLQKDYVSSVMEKRLCTLAMKTKSCWGAAKINDHHVLRSRKDKPHHVLRSRKDKQQEILCGNFCGVCMSSAAGTLIGITILLGRNAPGTVSFLVDRSTLKSDPS